MKWVILKWRWRRVFICALVCAMLIVIVTTSNSQVANPQAKSIVVNANDLILCALIGKMQVIALKYYYDPADADPRTLHPYAVGYSKKGNLLLFGRQMGGYSKSVEDRRGEIPGWRNFLVNGTKMGVVNALDSTFEPVLPNAAESRAITKYACKIDSEFGK